MKKANESQKKEAASNKVVAAAKKARSATPISAEDHIPLLQQTSGNQAVQRLYLSGKVQAALKVGQPNDPYEQEADRIAEEVTRTPEAVSGAIQRTNTPVVQKEENKTSVPEPEKEKVLNQKLALQLPQPDFLKMRRPFLERNASGLWDPDSALAVWKYNFDFFKRLGFKDDRAGKASNLTAPFAIDAQLKADKPKWWEITDTELKTTTITLSIPLLDFDADFRNLKPLPFLQKKAAEAGPGTGAAPQPSAARSILPDAGEGRSLDESLRNYFEPKLGSDFSNVRVHTGPQAAESARSLNARAYTLGNNVVFGEGEYQPGTVQGKKLIAHELTHVVQQGSTDTVRRKILIAGKYYIPKQDYDWIKKSYGSAMVEFLERMHNKGNPPEYNFKDYAEMHTEVRTRSYLIKGMGAAAGTCCDYPSVHAGGYLDSTYWEKKGNYHFTIKNPLPSGKEPSDAIEAVFKSNAGTELECNSMMVTVQYYSILQAIGKDRFNKRFPNGSGIVVKPVLVDLSSGIGPDQPNALKTENLYDRVTITGFADLLPGDWVYFLNVPDYLTKHPGGFWSGEHALYLGNDTFSGFGVYGLTNDQMLARLLENYNDGLPPAQQKKITDVPGIMPQVIRRPTVKSYAP